MNYHIYNQDGTIEIYSKYCFTDNFIGIAFGKIYNGQSKQWAVLVGATVYENQISWSEGNFYSTKYEAVKKFLSRIAEIELKIF